jgi:hypothetical protein
MAEMRGDSSDVTWDVTVNSPPFTSKGASNPRHSEQANVNSPMEVSS